MLYNNILEAIGNTPLIKLNKIVGPDMANIYVKYEAVNIGGSVKTRTAYNMIVGAELDGILKPDSIIVEPTSGNQGIGLSLIGAVKGYKVIIIMPDSVSVERRKLITQYGAELKLIHDDGNIGECIDKCMKEALRMKAEDPRVFVPQQFENPKNPAAQRCGTGAEILSEFQGTIDGFCSGIGTGGTLTGIGEILKMNNPNIEIWALEPENAAILSGKPVGTHIQMGIGDGVIPKNLNREIYDHIEIITDEEAVEMSRRLAREEGMLCGITSGTNVVGAMRLAKKLGPGHNVVTLLPDTGERYISTVLFE